MNQTEVYTKDWNKWISEVLGAKLDPEQKKIVESVQENRRTTVRSGHARGKDYVAACISLAFLYLHIPCKVINTAPTQRQVISIMMSEISNLILNARKPIGGDLLSAKITFKDEPDTFLQAFKAQDKKAEAWTGYHSQNILVVVTEASGNEQETFDAIDGILTGNSRFLLVGNPTRKTGEFYQSFQSSLYSQMVLNCMEAVNVKEKKTVIPGQVDWYWVDEKVKKWCTSISKSEFRQGDGAEYDFEWEGKHYRPNDLFLVKVMGEFPRQDEDSLVPLNWIEAANERWLAYQTNGQTTEKLKLGLDVAGMGNDLTCFAFRRDNVIEKFTTYAKSDHMEIAGITKNLLAESGDMAYVDTIGEGAGVYSRLIEQNQPAVSVKFSESADKLTDLSGERKFVNMRAYCYWAIRDALDPKYNSELALPPDSDLTEELTNIRYKTRSDGKIILEPKEDLKLRLGRSPDKSDSIAVTFYPKKSGDVLMDFYLEGEEV